MICPVMLEKAVTSTASPASSRRTPPPLRGSIRLTHSGPTVASASSRRLKSSAFRWPLAQRLAEVLDGPLRTVALVHVLQFTVLDRSHDGFLLALSIAVRLSGGIQLTSAAGAAAGHAAGHDGRADVDQHAGRGHGLPLGHPADGQRAGADLDHLLVQEGVARRAAVHAHQVAQLEGFARAVQLEHAGGGHAHRRRFRPRGSAAWPRPGTCGPAPPGWPPCCRNRAAGPPAWRCRCPAKGGRRSRSRSPRPRPRPRDWCRRIANASCHSWFRSLEKGVKLIGSGVHGSHAST